MAMFSMIFYRSFYDAIEDLDDDSRLRLLEAVIRFGLYDEEPELKGIEKSLWTVMRPLIETNKERAMNGKKGGRPRKKPLVSESENHRLSNGITIGFANPKPNNNKNNNNNNNKHHHAVSKTVSENLCNDAMDIYGGV